MPVEVDHVFAFSYHHLSGQKFEFVGPFMSKNHGSMLSRACKRLFCILSKKKANVLLQ